MKKLALIIILIIISISMVISQAGIIDKSFGVNGFITEKADIYSHEMKMVIQNDGKIVIAGSLEYAAGNLDIFVIRYNIDGTIDRNLIIDIDNKDNHATSLALETTGKILVTGFSGIGTDSYVIRLNPNLTYDNNFGQKGIVRFNFSSKPSDIERIKGIVIYSPGEYYISGDAKIENKNNDLDMFIFKLTPGGLIDNSFNNGNVLFLDEGDNYNYFNTSLLIQGNKLIVCGYSKNSEYTFIDLFYVLNNGSSYQHKYFGLNSIYTTYPNEFKLLHDNKIVTIGPSNNFGGGDVNIFIAKFLADGDLDSSFGHNGIKYIDIFDAKKVDEPFSLIEMPENNYVIAGSKYEIKWSWESSYVLSIKDNGDINKSFGENTEFGITNWNLEGHKLESAIACAYNSVNQRIYVVGKTYDENSKFLYLTRLSSGLSAIKEISESNDNLTIFPNPATDNISLNFKGVVNGKIEIKIFDLSGNKINRISEYQNKKIDFKEFNLKQGLYFIQVINDKKIYNKRFLVIK